jgi:putative MATE family efflux protein
MEDLTTGPLTRHLLKTTSFMLVTMIFQTLYYLIDLFWVGRLGTQAIAAVGIAGNFTFIVLALTQMLGVGTTTAVSHAVGRKNRAEAELMFNQAQVLAVVTGILFLIVGMLVRLPYSRALAPDAETAALAAQYLLWFIPAMALQFLMVAAGAALRAVGNFKAGMIVSTGSVITNMVLAPFLIFGWWTGHAYGVAGAAISSLIAVVVAVVWFATYFLPKDSYLRFVRADLKPQFALWRKMLAIGLPAGFEFGMMGVYLVVVYAIARPFGAAAQAGFGIGQRVIQALFMPAVALGFSVAPVAGQNFGARSRERVLEGPCRAGRWNGVPAHRVVELHCIRFGLRGVEHVPGDGKYDSIAGGFRHADSARNGAGNPALPYAGLSTALGMVSVCWRGARSACAQHAAAAPRIQSPADVPIQSEAGRQHRPRVSDGGGGVIVITEEPDVRVIVSGLDNRILPFP